MPNWRIFVLVLFFSVPGMGGCQRSPSENPAGKVIPQAPPVWLEQDLKVDGLTIFLGYRGDLAKAGERLEPTVTITQDGKPVAEGMVFLRLVSADGLTTLGEEVATVFEPATGGNSACYAQGKLKLPEKGEGVAIRFRLILPGRDEEWIKDVVLPSK